MRSFFRLDSLALAFLSVFLPHAAAQTAPVVQQSLSFPWDSGSRSNPSATEQVLASHTVRVANASWIRLRFQLAQLWNDGDERSGAFLRITSHADGAVQELRSQHVREWRLTSAYFNGDAVQLELVAPAGAGPSRVQLRSLWIGPQMAPQFSQCGPLDDRQPSGDPRTARLMPIGCTGWMFDDPTHGFGTAGHCVAAGTVPNPWVDVAEFDVPFSMAGGILQHPSPDDQYAIDDTSIQYENGGVGNDWAYLGCFANSNTGLTPFQAQGACFALVPAPAFAPSEVMRITGYGTDSTPDSTYNQVQQTDTGPYFSFSGSTLRYTVDTTGGNSGSPIIWETGASDQVIGVHTHGGCSTSVPSAGNHGTESQQANWVNARNNPLGVCDPQPSVANYCTAKVNSLGCTPSIGASGSPSFAAGPGSFTISASQLLNQKAGFFFYGLMPSAAPFQGGFKCVKSPTRRTALQSTGGSTSVADCSGVLQFDMGARIAAGVDVQLALGAIVYVQAWSRDAADPFTTNLTGGLKFTIGP